MAVGKVFLPSGKGLFQKMLAVRKFRWGGDESTAVSASWLPLGESVGSVLRQACFSHGEWRDGCIWLPGQPTLSPLCWVWVRPPFGFGLALGLRVGSGLSFSFDLCLGLGVSPHWALGTCLPLGLGVGLDLSLSRLEFSRSGCRSRRSSGPGRVRTLPQSQAWPL